MNDILVQWCGGGGVNNPKSANYYVFRYFLQVILENTFLFIMFFVGIKHKMAVI
jgi:hypothetical protein